MAFLVAADVRRPALPVRAVRVSSLRPRGVLKLRRAIHRVAPTANNTTVTELSGINTAHTSGESRPAAAMETPTTF